MMDNYSLSDIAAATGNEKNAWDGGWFWIVVLFLFMFGFGGNGFGFGGVNGALTRAELADGFNFNQLENATRAVQQGLCDGFYAQNTTMLNGFNGVQTGIANLGYQMQNCCCETNRNIDSVRYDASKNACDITTAIHAEGEATRALITQNTVQDLRDRLAERDRELLSSGLLNAQQIQSQTLINALRPFPQPAYITCSPYTAAATNMCNCCA